MKKILAVDDDLDIHKLLNVYLRSTYSVQSALNGQDALKLLAEDPGNLPDLILLDMEMPEMNGRDFKKKLDQSPLLKDIPVIYLSANNRYKDEVDLDLDFAFLNKPIEKEDLLSVLDSFFRLSDSH